MNKICVGIPTNRQFKPQTVLSLANMISYTRGLGHEIFITIPTEGYNTAENRNFTVAQAIKEGCSHILFSDDDMSYPEDTLERLLSHNKALIGTLYNVRRLPSAFVIGYQQGGISSDEEARKQIEPFQCEAIGTGMLLVKTEVFSKLQSPFFGYKWHDNGMVKMSTDWFMCEKARQAGFEIWCDPTISIKHIGDYAY